MTDFGITSGQEYAKKRQIFSKICYFGGEKFNLMAISGQIFDNYNAIVDCSIQSHKFKECFRTFRSFVGNLQIRYKLTNY